MTPNEIAAKVRLLALNDHGLETRAMAAWNPVQADLSGAWPPCTPLQYQTARLAFLTAIADGREGDAAHEARVSVGLESGKDPAAGAEFDIKEGWKR